MRLHQRQFRITARRFDPDESLPVIGVDGGLRLGIALHGGSESADHAFAGRFVTVRDDTITLDAVGSLACYYRTVDGEIWASSSPEMLRTLEPVLGFPRERVQWRGPRLWFPPPLSGIESIRRLLPTQSLNLRDGTVSPHANLPPVPWLRYEDALNAIEALLRRIVSVAAERFPLWVPLTSGRDSRLILAACAAEGLDVQTFTFEPPEDAPVRRPHDVVFAQRIAARLGIPHRVVPTTRADPELARLFDTHTAFHSNDFERAVIIRHQWEQVPAEALVLGGSVWEVARGFFWDKQPPVPEEYRSWVNQHPSKLDWRDRMYIDQRMGGWLGANEQGFDVTGRQRIHPANCGELLALLLSLPANLRRDGIHHADLVRRMCPRVADIPVNPIPTVGRRVRARISRERFLMRNPDVNYVSHRVRRVLRRLRTTQRR